MGSNIRGTKLSLKEELENRAHNFSFEMASYILEHGSEFSFGKESSVWEAPFKTVSINSFYLRATEIEKITKVDGKNVVFVERLAIAGLNAPLPTPYAELVMNRSREKDFAMQAFINMFNSRLLGISYQVSKRRYLCLQKHSKENCMLVKSIATLFGENPEKMNRNLVRLAYLFWTREKSAVGLEAIITSVFQLETKVRQFRNSWVDLNEHNALGENYRLGKNSGLGSRASLCTHCVEINLTHDKFEMLSPFLSGKLHHQKMTYFIRKYLGDFLSCRIRITPRSVPPLILDRQGNVVLGRTAWFPGKNNVDSAVVNIPIWL